MRFGPRFGTVFRPFRGPKTIEKRSGTGLFGTCAKYRFAEAWNPLKVAQGERSAEVSGYLSGYSSD